MSPSQLRNGFRDGSFEVRKLACAFDPAKQASPAEGGSKLSKLPHSKIRHCICEQPSVFEICPLTPFPQTPKIEELFPAKSGRDCSSIFSGWGTNDFDWMMKSVKA
jgi:hypothetical protein